MSRVEKGNSRVDPVDTVIDAVNSVFDRANSRIDAVKARFDQVNSRFEIVKDVFDDLNTFIDGAKDVFDFLAREHARAGDADHARHPPCENRRPPSLSCKSAKLHVFRAWPLAIPPSPDHS